MYFSLCIKVKNFENYFFRESQVSQSQPKGPHHSDSEFEGSGIELIRNSVREGAPVIARTGLRCPLPIPSNSMQ